MLEKNKALARRLLYELWNEENFEVVDKLIAIDYDGHSSTVINGPQGAKQFIPILRRALPDFKFTVLDQVAEADKVATRWMIRGTHEGEFQGIPPSGREIEINGITIFRIDDGLLVDGWTSEDILGLMQQLGAVPIAETG